MLTKDEQAGLIERALACAFDPNGPPDEEACAELLAYVETLRGTQKIDYRELLKKYKAIELIELEAESDE